MKLEALVGENQPKPAVRMGFCEEVLFEFFTPGCMGTSQGQVRCGGVVHCEETVC